MSNPATILLVDDEEAVQKLLTFPLERDGYRVVQARDGEEALRCFEEHQVDLVVLDLMLPRLDGIEVCKRLRVESHVPIIMLTARDDEVDKVLGLELGADDYITKPFSIREFRSRVKAALRRAAAPKHDAGEPETITIAGSPSIRRGALVTLNGDPIERTFVEFELLATLAARPGRVQPPGAARGAVGVIRTTETRARSMSTCDICAEAGTRAERPEYILTVRGVGCRFREPWSRCGASGATHARAAGGRRARARPRLPCGCPSL
jgi:DNA-binding response OmpR family regulator